MAVLIAKLVVAYLLGSLSGGLLLGRLRGLDIRRHGSGNAGGTNALRVAGWRFALAVVLIDVGKGALAAALGAWPSTPSPVDTGTAAAACVLAAAIGHCWPVWFGFRGGKGAATLVGGALVIAPSFAAAMFVAWILVIVATGYVGLATVVAACVFPLLVVGWDACCGDPGSGVSAFAFATAALVAWTHRGNLVRLRHGEEARFERARLFRRGGPR
ncbi:glycerol-3-phosphate 1-O-acyltransferase PlsY [Dokdonella sp. MW10]|uniref:glycerol-3-phosphate 1-O-acyltransferase PlsY n=1 Tax=Dokdonella sp. MW10 TaxID=2992926 RepID=UPI003F7F0DFB